MSPISMTFEAVREARPGPKWRRLFERYRPAYFSWFEARGGAGAPTRAECEAALERHMPELVATYRKLVALAGGGDTAARLLSCYRPPAYLVSCSQAALSTASGPLLVRNYDLDPALNEGLILATAWTGRRVIASSEFLWGAADGINEDGLAVSLAFGGSRETGDGFGIPLIVRYLLETCASVEEALAALARVPSHMAYNVTLVDREGAACTAQLKPGGGFALAARALATNHQGSAPVWPEHAAATRSVERAQALAAALEAPSLTRCGLVSRFLERPLYNTDYAGGFGTLYTAVYRPRDGIAEWHWPGRVWRQSFSRFEEGRRTIELGGGTGQTLATPPVWQAPADERGLGDTNSPGASHAEPVAWLGAWRAALAASPGSTPRALSAWFDAAEQSGRPDWAGLGRAYGGYRP